MKMLEEIKHYRKEFVHDQYTKIVEDFKDYDKISKVKMLQEIYKEFNDYNNIINICTEKELIFLKKIISKEDDCRDNKYEWERTNLFEKFIICDDYNNINISEEIESNVLEAIKHIDWKSVKELDRINEILVGYCKIQGTALVPSLVSLGSGLLNIKEEKLMEHIFKNKVFRYYVYIEDYYMETFKKNIPIAIFNDYYQIMDELDKQRRLQGKAISKKIDINEYRTMFYNDFNIKNKTINKFLIELDKLPFFSFSALKPIREYALLNVDRTSLKKSIKNVPMLKNENLDNFFILMDKAMDQMPSGALNGLTPKELRELNKEEREIENKKEKLYVKQTDAHLSNKDAKLFYKLYFGILDFTNQKYKIKPMHKLYGKNGINPYEISDIVSAFWKNKVSITMEFCLINPFKFNKEELGLVSSFKDGIRGQFILAKYEKEYTAIMNDDKIYMIKGLTSNIDEVIPYKDLPCMTETTIIPFKNVLVYDGMLQTYPINFGINFSKVVNKDYETKMKYYHL